MFRYVKIDLRLKIYCAWILDCIEIFICILFHFEDATINWNVREYLDVVRDTAQVFLILILICHPKYVIVNNGIWLIFLH